MYCKSFMIIVAG